MDGANEPGFGMTDAPNYPNITQLAVPFFIATMIAEILIGRITGRAKYETRDTAISLAMGFGSVAFDTALAFVAYGFLVWLWQYRLATLGFSVWVIALCFVLDDLRYYAFHRFSHRSRWGWASHVNHHTSQHYNLSTALRQTWTGKLTGLFVLQSPLVLLGFHPAVIVLCGGINLVYQYWIHTELIKKMPAWFEAVMNTPSHHRVHHAVNPKYLDANYAGTFIVWDRMFGSFVAEDAAEPCRYGIVKNLGTFNLFTVAFHEWWGILKDLFRPGLSWRARWNYVFNVPGWSHDNSRLTADMLKAEHVRLHPEKAGTAGLPSMTLL
jgi:sterol desaturase/sphingolipid hydroxylase (fatty acid hydroxylase superfamily)